jgi:glycosyltransferase involved in cell wall biosynthesis
MGAPLIFLRKRVTALRYLREVEIDGDRRIVLQDPDDAQALASAMQSLADDDARRSTMAMEARRVATSLSWKNMTEQYVKCYEGEIRNAH